MGMFDDLRIDIDLLPLSNDEKEKVKDNLGFQTKDFKCILSVAEIRKDGTLWFRDFEHVWDDSQKNAFGMKGVLKEKNVKWVHLDKYHGFVNFYSGSSMGWMEFNAKFTDGKLVEIKRV